MAEAMTFFERLVKQHVDKRTSLLAASIDPLAEQIVKDILADDAFRASLKTLVLRELGVRSELDDQVRRETRLEWWTSALLVIGVVAILVTAVIVILRAG